MPHSWILNFSFAADLVSHPCPGFLASSQNINSTTEGSNLEVLQSLAKEIWLPVSYSGHHGYWQNWYLLSLEVSERTQRPKTSGKYWLQGCWFFRSVLRHIDWEIQKSKLMFIRYACNYYSSILPSACYVRSKSDKTLSKYTTQDKFREIIDWKGMLKHVKIWYLSGNGAHTLLQIFFKIFFLASITIYQSSPLFK